MLDQCVLQWEESYTIIGELKRDDDRCKEADILATLIRLASVPSSLTLIAASNISALMPKTAGIDSKATSFLLFLSSSDVSIHVDSEYSNNSRIAIGTLPRSEERMTLGLSSETQPRLSSLRPAIEDGKNALKEYVAVDGEWGFAECGLDAAEARRCWEKRVSKKRVERWRAKEVEYSWRK